MIARGFGTAAVLMTLVLLLFVVARLIGSDNNRFKAIWSAIKKGNKK